MVPASPREGGGASQAISALLGGRATVPRTTGTLHASPNNPEGRVSSDCGGEGSQRGVLSKNQRARNSPGRDPNPTLG